MSGASENAQQSKPQHSERQRSIARKQPHIWVIWLSWPQVMPVHPAPLQGSPPVQSASSSAPLLKLARKASKSSASDPVGAPPPLPPSDAGTALGLGGRASAIEGGGEEGGAPLEARLAALRDTAASGQLCSEDSRSSGPPLLGALK